MDWSTGRGKNINKKVDREINLDISEGWERRRAEGTWEMLEKG